MIAKYINPFSDYGFKKLFGEEASKAILIDFLNALIPTAGIKDLTFKNTEQLGDTLDGRRVVFDIYCENDKGEKFIVELQKARQDFFKERTIYYSTFPIREQVERGDWSYDINAVFCIGILDFTFKDYESEAEKGHWFHEVKLKNQRGVTFYNKLTYLYLEMPNFKKSEHELSTRLDKWLYFFKHLEDFDAIPEIFNGEVVFMDAFHKAELSAFTVSEYNKYEYSLRAYRDWHNVIESAKRETARLVSAETEARVKAETETRVREETETRVRAETERGMKIEMALKMKQNDIATDIICLTTGLSISEIEAL